MQAHKSRKEKDKEMRKRDLKNPHKLDRSLKIKSNQEKV